MRLSSSQRCWGSVLPVIHTNARISYIIGNIDVLIDPILVAALLGMSPPWYKSRSYRARAVRDPRGVLKEFGVDLPDSVSVRVHDSTADLRYGGPAFVYYYITISWIHYL